MTSSAFWNGRKVFVTGCMGFLGSWLTKELIALKAEVVGLVRDSVWNSPFSGEGGEAQVHVVRGAVEDLALVERAINEYELETVFHLAAQAIVGVANRNPLSTFETNIRGTWVLLEACRRCPSVKRIVVASSDKAYGAHDDLPYKETAPLEGRHPYDVSKSCADLIATSYSASFQMPVCITRCGNLFGPADLNFNRIVPGTIRSALLGERPVIRSDGSPIRDYVYVKDVASAYLHLAERMDDPGLHGQAFNIGTGEPVSVLELTHRILAVTGRSDLEPIIQSNASREIPRQYLSSEKARDILGWQPGGNLDHRLRETADWYRAHGYG
jgi:CDP-glucose 4,6-dehydratase